MSRAGFLFLAARLSRMAPLAVALLAAGAAHAQFKIIGPDGKITYTDREPSASDGKVIALGARAPTQAAEPDLPFELRAAANKYPVTLFTISGACEPCTLARQMLKQRGIPFNERQVVTAEDSEALEKLSGAREAPTLTIGSQTLRGLATEVWNSYLDAAGYPRESRLPSSYQYRPATPIVDRREPATARSDVRPEATPAPAAPTAPGAGGIRF
jgi:glutaredoxin